MVLTYQTSSIMNSIVVYSNKRYVLAVYKTCTEFNNTLSNKDPEDPKEGGPKGSGPTDDQF